MSDNDVTTADYDEGTTGDTTASSEPFFPPPTPGVVVHGPWLTLKDAALEAGVSVSALRKWYRAGEIESKLEAGRRMVLLNEVFERAAKHRPAPPAAVEAAKPVIAAEWRDLIHRIADSEQARANAERDAAIASHDLLRSREEAARQRDEIDQLRRELDAAKGAMGRWTRRRFEKERGS